MNQEELWLLEDKYHGIESEAFRADLLRLADGEPLAYVIGSIPFLSSTIYLDSHPLIPRPETEFWAEKAITEIKQTFHSNGRFVGGPKVLDLCAGSGAIGVAVAKAITSAVVDFGEIDNSHLPTIEKNLKANSIDASRYHIIQSDLFKNITGTYDFILTNPPYIDPALDRAEVSVKTHEPHLALYGGSDGLELIAKIITDTLPYLKENGQLWIEHEPEQAEMITQLASASYTIVNHPDQYGVIRYSTLTKKVE